MNEDNDSLPYRHLRLASVEEMMAMGMPQEDFDLMEEMYGQLQLGDNTEES